MIMGEHGVLRGKSALVAAVNRRLRVHLSPRRDRKVSIRSALGTYEADLDQLEVRAPFRFILAAVQQARPETGFALTVESDFSERVGLGSSAAVTVATQAALMRWQAPAIDFGGLFNRSRDAVRAVQGLGSGADVAASVWGGLLAYRAEPFELRRFEMTLPLTVIYSGYKRPTPEVVAQVERARQQQPERFDRLFEAQDQATRQAVEALERADLSGLGVLMNVQQGIMEELGVSDAALSEIVQALRARPEIRGAKISGSGLGDCVIGLGSTSMNGLAYEQIPVDVSTEGVRIE
jgi:mevalonate kinase